MNSIKWLVTIADEKPLLLSLALLMIAVSTLGLVIKNMQGKIDRYELRFEAQEIRYQHRLDSLNIRCAEREKEVLNESKVVLNDIIQDYKKRLDNKVD